MKTVIITGANGNLGSAVTNEFLSNGYNVIATVIDSSMKDEFTKNDQLEVMAVDLMKETAALEFVQKCIDKYKKIDAALCLVGGYGGGDISSTNMSDIEKLMALNFKTAYYTAQPLFEHMMNNKQGRLVFVGARPALVPAEGKKNVAYALSKSLLFRLAEILNETAKGTNVTATVVVPSTLDTPQNRKSMPKADPGDWVKPSALAEVLAFAVSDASSIIREPVIKVYNNA